MNRFYTLIAVLSLIFVTFGQTPEKMSYQAIIRDSGGYLLVNKEVGMQISILQGGAEGTAIYVETHNPTTNNDGLVSLEIGSGVVVNSDFSAIDWSNSTYFIKTETDPAGGSNYTITGTSQLLSVPYAMHAKSTTTATTLSGGIDQSYIEALEPRIVLLEPAIGDIIHGGAVFYIAPEHTDLDGNGTLDRGLVCSLIVQSAEWGCYGDDLPNVSNVTWHPPSGEGAEIGGGMRNTNAILNDCPSAPAALAARSLGAEWFLPNSKELNEMYKNQAALEAVLGFEAFRDYFYWSSTEVSNAYVWIQYFGDGNQSYSSKFNTYDVRAIRAF